MAKIKKTIRAGSLVKVVLYTAPEPRDGPQARAEKSRATTAARKWINDKTARGKMEMLLWANFTEKDLYVTLTYDDAHLPKNRKEAQENVRKFIRRLREHWKRAGEELRYIYVTENKHGDGRYHHHLFINSIPGDNIVPICSLWQNGEQVEVIVVSDMQDLSEWAGYITKERGDRPLGKRMWVSSKNLRQPIIEREFVPNDTALAVPSEGYVIEKGGKDTEYGSYTYIKYRILPPRTTQRKPFYQEYRDW